MAMDLLLFASVFAISGIIFLPLHVSAVRVTRGRNLLSVINLMICLSALIGGAIGWFLLGDLFSSAGTKAVACVGGSFSFVGFGGVYNLIGPASADRSISAHLVNLIYYSPSHQMSKADVFSLYTHADIIEKRFTECTEAGVIEQHGSQLVLTARGRHIAVAFATLGKVLGLHPWYMERLRAR